MAQVPDHGVPLEASGLPKPPDLAHHLENASEPVHIELEEMAGDVSARDNESGLGRFSWLIQISVERLAELLAYV
ncbi:hypothetical protein GQ457_01G026210 [Hibiscus cannabinus]